MLVIGNVLLIDCLGVIVRPGLVVGGCWLLLSQSTIIIYAGFCSTIILAGAQFHSKFQICCAWPRAMWPCTD
jgi:hypothetical protein